MLLTQLAATRTVLLSVYTNFSTNVCTSGDLTKHICCTLCCFAAAFNIFAWLLLTVMAVCSFVCAVFWFWGSHTTLPHIR